MKLTKKGFTLIEVMIVLAIIGLMVVVGAPRLFHKENNIKSIARHFIVMSREIRNKARLSNSTYRLCIRMEPNKEAYWVERANGPQLIDDPATAEEKAKHKDDKKDDDKDHPPPPPPFQIDKSLTKKETPLTGEMHFTSVETSSMKAPMTEGTAYIHFFAEGFVEAAVLQISVGKNLTWTLVFNPLTGQAEVVEKAITLKDIQR